MRFGLVGLSGYIARRHVHVIKQLGHDLVAAVDPHDNVGWVDEYFPGCHFFKEPERFERHLRKLRRRGVGIDYLVVCTPNWLHDVHCCMGLQVDADVICEKPLVINPWNLDEVQEIESEYDHRVWAILQLRYHEQLRALRQVITEGDGYHDVELTYVTRRGRWYDASWKGDEAKSGGLAMNLGVHFFDALSWVFGDCRRIDVRERSARRMSGTMRFDKAAVRWMLSVDSKDLPESVVEAGGFAHRVLKVDGDQIDLSTRFGELHARAYQEILAGRGFGIEDARAAIDLVYRVRNRGA